MGLEYIPIDLRASVLLNNTSPAPTRNQVDRAIEIAYVKIRREK